MTQVQILNIVDVLLCEQFNSKIQYKEWQLGLIQIVFKLY